MTSLRNYLLSFGLSWGIAFSVQAECIVTTNQELVVGHYPRFTELASGDVLMSLDRTETINGRTGQAIVVYRGDNTLRRWEQIAIPAFDPPTKFSNAYMIVLAAKANRPETILLAMRAWNGADAWLDLLESTDQGKNWKFRGRIFSEFLRDTTSGESDNGELVADVSIYEPQLWVSDKGNSATGTEKLLVTYASEVTPTADKHYDGDQVLFLQRSDDLGFTWQLPYVVTPREQYQRFGMPALVSLDNNIMAIFYEQVDLTPERVFDWWPYKKRTRWHWTIRSTVSLDGGLSWINHGYLLFDSRGGYRDNIGGTVNYSGAPTALLMRIPGMQTQSVGVIFQVGDVPSYSERHKSRISTYFVGLNTDGTEFYRAPLPNPSSAWWPSSFQNSTGRIILAGDQAGCIQMAIY